uniref:PIN domain-containing protein n=1 Tax=Candidatus Kentrum sp. FM TaxID=2126340 RepID=A0A450VUL3_9GAMM|nr:MAG: hypothetical protein BECKFM1743A_GA0114220_100638 [Candidatus Kentron sp. FM]VFJ49315.1 MAG: hypothetical protein BECKFM1743C_GA0114222_100698 [Candidatus Kentron sp. FM]VFK08475.1 MAG: hypothetical protein BECKFM1743B_GA0114221_100718 [Candidatus Kentron sp. FM]
MRVYLDNCAFNRPFDDQGHIRIRLEAEAKLYLQEKIKNREIALVWSYILDIENDRNPFEEKRNAIRRWKELACADIEETDALIEMANRFVRAGIRTKDALHVAAAIAGRADAFITTDDKLLGRLVNHNEIRAVNPIDIVGELHEHRTDEHIH